MNIEMKIEIKKLTPELMDDYIYFFENLDFSHNPDWGGCYCVWYHWNEEDGETCSKRELAMRYIKEGILQGYLAYAEGSVVGWCNSNDKSSYAGLSIQKHPEYWQGIDDSKKVKLIVCYTIASEMRQKGIATQLLQRVCEDAKIEGYHCVEAYPDRSGTNQQSYHGPYSIYEKNGFTICKDLGKEVIVRKYF